MTDLRKAAEMALDALHNIDQSNNYDAIEALRQALAQEEKPPVKSYCGGKPNYCTPVDAVNMSQERVDETAKREHEPVEYTGNGTAGREANVQPTGFFFQIPKPVGEVYGWHGTGKGQPMCRFDSTEASMPVGTKLYTAPPKREWVGLTDDDVHDAFNYVEMVKFLDFDRDRPEWCKAFARACEATLRHRNGEKQ